MQNNNKKLLNLKFNTESSGWDSEYTDSIDDS